MPKQSKESKIEVDLTVYPMEAIQAAAYSLTDRLVVKISRNGKSMVSVVLKPKSDGDPEALSGAFHNELLHESLRLQVSQANQMIREYIVTKALVSAQVPSAVPPMGAAEAEKADAAACPECETQQAPVTSPPAIDSELEKEIEKLLAEIEKGDGAADPLGVAVPWEEKFGAKTGKDAAPSTAAPSKRKARRPRAA